MINGKIQRNKGNKEKKKNLQKLLMQISNFKSDIII